jgi:hypothetical protein
MWYGVGAFPSYPFKGDASSGIRAFPDSGHTSINSKYRVEKYTRLIPAARL